MMNKFYQWENELLGNILYRLICQISNSYDHLGKCQKLFK